MSETITIDGMSEPLMKHYPFRARSSERTTIAPPGMGSVLRRRCACGNHAAGGDCAACRQTQRQRSAAQTSDIQSGPPIVHEVLRSPGQPLDAATRTFMESRFGHDFSRVRVHTDARATKSASAVNASAYTVGCNVVFAASQYAPTSRPGRTLLAHELAHVVQQRDAGAGSPLATLPVGPSTDAAEQEADAMAGAVLSDRASRPAILHPTNARISRQVNPMAESERSEQPFKRGTGATLPYREATELAECIRIMGEANAAYCRQAVLGEAPPAAGGAASPPVVKVERQGATGNSFITTDSITLTASVTGGATPPAAPTGVDWTVRGVSANAGNGNPHTATNQTQFTFRPNPTNRPTTGSRTANDPIQYRVEARSGGGIGTFDLTQDETDIIRQEYIDLGPTTPPARSEIVTPTNAAYNVGNYSLIVDRGMDNAFTNTETEFQTLTPGGAAPAINVTSGYRNPRRNVAAGSNFPVTSRHVWGSALDLTVAGANATLWARLRQAGANAGNTSICENGPTQIPCNDPNVDHVHIQW
jgi:hypothetical protein